MRRLDGSVGNAKIWEFRLWRKMSGDAMHVFFSVNFRENTFWKCNALMLAAYSQSICSFQFNYFIFLFVDLFICATPSKICVYSILAARAAFETTKKDVFYLLDFFRPKDFSDCRTQRYDSLWFTNHYRIMWVEGYLISYKYKRTFCKGWVFWVFNW